MIPNRPPPRLRAGSRWSNLFSDFIAHCLEKNSENRASAQELLQVTLSLWFQIAPIHSRCSRRT